MTTIKGHTIRWLVLLELLDTTSVSVAQGITGDGLFSPKEQVWLARRGFPIDDYHGDKVIDLHLERAINYRNQSVLFISGGSAVMGVGIIVLSIGIAGVIAETLVSYLPGADANRHLGTINIGAIMAGSGLVIALTGGIYKHHQARRMVQMATVLYQ